MTPHRDVMSHRDVMPHHDMIPYHSEMPRHLEVICYRIMISASVIIEFVKNLVRIW